MSRLFVAAACGALLLLVGCSSGPEPSRGLAEAFAGPATLKLHEEVDPRSAEVVTVHHGDRLTIVRRRRRFVKVRTASGAEGWTDLRQLLATAQMQELNRLAELARQLPSQGTATVFEDLNVHTEPNRQAPGFYKIREGELVDVVGHQLSQRVPFDLADVLPQPARPPVAKKPQEPRIPKPPAPGLPDNWLDLSKTKKRPGPVPPPEPPKPAPADEWSLVRLGTRRGGWVLTNQLKMNIPDEVAQYSEGHRITSYFAMADIQDGGRARHNWLWTTLSGKLEPYEFDSVRYFIWNPRHHRYETSHIERNLKGFYPVEVNKVRLMVGGKEDTFPGFKLLVEDADGIRWRKQYAFQYFRVVLVSKERVQPPQPAPSDKHAETLLATLKTEEPERSSLYARLRRNLAALKARWFKK